MTEGQRARACMLDYAKRHWLPIPDFDTVLGKGTYGTAYATSDPKQVVKVTKDPDEGLLMAAQLQYQFLGVVPCRGALHLVHDKWVLWKDALDKISYDAWFAKFPGIKWRDADPSAQWRDLTAWIDDRRSGGAGALGKEDAIAALYAYSERWQPMRDIVETCVYMIERFDAIPGDMHYANFGCWDNYDQMILFDAQMGDFAEQIEYESCSDVG